MSAYHVEVDRRRREKGEPSNRKIEGWRMLWKLNVPRVVKVFVWKALNNSLPTRLNLFLKKIIEEVKCPVCKR